jgi:hypothetical protein
MVINWYIKVYGEDLTEMTTSVTSTSMTRTLLGVLA